MRLDVNGYVRCVFIFAFIFHLFGCSSIGRQLLPLHDEVLLYDLPFDLTYLRTMEALESHPDWELETTDKEKGLIMVRNINYSQFSDADKRRAVFWIKRVSRRETSVRLAPESQHVIGGDKLLELIAKHVSREL